MIFSLAVVCKNGGQIKANRTRGHRPAHSNRSNVQSTCSSGLSSPVWISSVLYVAMASNSSTTQNGSAATSDAVCSAINEEPSPLPPAVASNTEATAPSLNAQKMRCNFGGSVIPPAVRTSMTCDAESDDVTKYVVSPIIEITDTAVERGSIAKVSKRMSCALPKHDSLTMGWPSNSEYHSVCGSSQSMPF